MPITRLRRAFKLHHEETETETYYEIKEGVIFRGYNLWLLILSMGIACVGLNINSPAAVIGAMLISPLMGPVVGLSFGLSIQDRGLVRLSIYHWIVMVLTALGASALYFLISPFHSPTSQLASFKDATVFDCFLALFGGFAWFLGLMRKEAIKVIAGVAVSTACIPPLCTAGFGLANGNWEFFLGGLYFYMVNCVFIGIGTWILSIILGYQSFFLEKKINTNRKMTIIIGIVSLIMLTPSIFFTYKKWKDEKLRQQAVDYVTLIQKKNPTIQVVKYDIIENEKDQKILDITILNDSTFLTKAELDSHDALRKDISLKWHYAPESAAHSNKFLALHAEMEKLKLEMKQLQDSLKAR